MEITEFLKQNNIEVKSTAKELTKMYQHFVVSSDFEKTFKKIQANWNGEPMTVKTLQNFLNDKLDVLKQIDPDKISSLTDAIGFVMLKIIEQKTEFAAKMTQERVAESTSVPDYYQMGKPIDMDVEIFQTIDKEPNEFDKDLYKCFCKAGEHIVFVSQDATKLITQNNDGSLALGNDMTSMKEGALWSCICKAMKNEFNTYKNRLLEELAKITLDDLDIEVTQNVVEKIFLEKIPCSFSHLVNIVKRYKKAADGSVHFDGFRAKPNKKMVDTFDFDSFVTALAKNFQKMTRGALSEQDEYKAFSNRLDEAAVTHWILPSEDIWKKATLPTEWKQFFSGKAETRILARVFWYIGAMQDAKNMAEQALIISDGGGTGKSTLMHVLQKLFPDGFFGYINNQTLNDTKDFALSEKKVYEHHCLILDEYDGHSINSPVFKNLIGTKTPIVMPVKNKQAIEHNFSGTKMIVLSNERSVLDSHAFRRRVIPVSFNLNHKGKDAFGGEHVERLIATGPEFLNFCYRYYKECKCVKANGEYYVLSPEQEEKFLNGEELDRDEKLISTKAISNDEAIAEFFDVHDYEDSDLNFDVKEFIDELFELGEDTDMLPVKDLINIIKQKLNGTDSERELTSNIFDGSINTIRKEDGEYERSINVRGKSWYIFKEVMKTMGFKYKTLKHDKKAIKAWTNIKIKIPADIQESQLQHPVMAATDISKQHLTPEELAAFIKNHSTFSQW